MGRPELKDFGITQQDVDWAEKADSRLPFLVFFASALGWGIYAIVTTESFQPILILVFLVVGFAVVMLTTLVLVFPAELFLRVLVPHYRKAQRYRKELDEFRAWWARTQKEFWLSLTGKQFEAELAALFRRAGLRAELTSASGDQGVDIWLYTERGREIVQCKAHQTPVGPAVARELYGTLQHFGAAAATLASTSGFTRGVVDYVRGKPIKLLGLSEIVTLQEKTSSEL